MRRLKLKRRSFYFENKKQIKTKKDARHFDSFCSKSWYSYFMLGDKYEKAEIDPKADHYVFWSKDGCLNECFPMQLSRLLLCLCFRSILDINHYVLSQILKQLFYVGRQIWKGWHRPAGRPPCLLLKWWLSEWMLSQCSFPVFYWDYVLG